MPYSSIFVNGDFTKLKQGFDSLVDNGIIGSVVLDTSGTYPVIILYTDAESTNEFFRITESAGVQSKTTYTFLATNSDGQTLSMLCSVENNQGKVIGYNLHTIYICDNGVMCNCEAIPYSGDRVVRMWFVITSNQNNDPVVIWSNATNTATTESLIKDLLNTEYIVCSSDTGSESETVGSSPAYRDQTVLSPFFSSSSAGTVSYTPNACRLLAGNLNALITYKKPVQMMLDGSLWLTNGYWALKV